MPSARRLESAESVGLKRSWKKASVGPAVGQAATTASAPEVSSPLGPLIPGIRGLFCLATDVGLIDECEGNEFGRVDLVLPIATVATSKIHLRVAATS